MDIEELVYYNLSFNISVEETLEDIDRMDLLYMFEDYLNIDT
tara:strand:+ start:438 stop:563 length:126 start_codon:yes stop_codon:yes gene_type:complete